MAGDYDGRGSGSPVSDPYIADAERVGASQSDSERKADEKAALENPTFTFGPGVTVSKDDLIMQIYGNAYNNNKESTKATEAWSQTLRDGGFLSKAEAKYPSQIATRGIDRAVSAYMAYSSQVTSPDNFQDWVREYSRTTAANAEPEGGGGGYSGPVSSVTFANEAELRTAADTVGATVFGRGVTDSEFDKVLKKIRKGERDNPTVSSGSGGSRTTKSGLSAEGKGNIIRDTLMKGPEAKDFSKATKMMDLFSNALKVRPDGA